MDIGVGEQSFEELWTMVVALVTSYGLSVIGAIVILIVGFVIAGWVRRSVEKGLSKFRKVDETLRSFFSSLAYYAVIVFTIIAVLSQFGVETTSFIAVLGAAGLAIGLALQGTLSNVAAGVMILAFRPFKIGDAVKLDGDVFVIDSLGFFACRAHLPDGPQAFLPNAKIWGEKIVNFSVTHDDMRRIDEVYGIAYGDDIGTALDLLRQVVADEPRVLKTPEPLVKVESLGDSSVNILFRVWTLRADWWDTKLDLLKRNKEALEAGGITIPFPQRDLHVFTQPPAPAPLN